MDSPEPSVPPPYASAATRLVVAYAWVILKNILGWAMMILAIPSGVVIPGPNGLVMFLIGFALVSFPGKRRLTARVLRGKPLDPRGLLYRAIVVVISLLLPAGAMLYVHHKHLLHVARPGEFPLAATAAYIGIVAILLLGGLFGGGAVNWVLRTIARGRRAVRPWLRVRGIDLLPPRRRRHRRLIDGQLLGRVEESGVIEIHPRHLESLGRWAKAAWPWLRRFIGMGLVVIIFYRMLRPVVKNWYDPAIHTRILQLNWGLFAVAAVMFAITSLACRVPSWRWVLKGLGYSLPYRPAARIWSTSEMVRYIPGVVWQVLGRVYLVRPYGIPAAVCSISQVLEITIFVLANVMIAVAGLSLAGLGGVEAKYRTGVYFVFALVPLLLVLLHPMVFYGALNWILRKFKKPQITQKLGERKLLGLVCFAIAGLLWQSLGVWILTYAFLEFPLSQFWVLAGSYSAAWTAGFCLASVFPAGIGVREAVFVAVASIAMPPAMREQLSDPKLRSALLAFLSVLLRLWTIAGELIVVSIAYAIDRQGAMNRPGAVGRIAPAGPQT